MKNDIYNETEFNLSDDVQVYDIIDTDVEAPEKVKDIPLKEKKNFKTFLGNALDSVKEGSRKAKDWAGVAGKDIQNSAEKTASSIENTVDKLKERARTIKEEMDRETYKPVFFEDYVSETFDMPSLIRVIDSDPKREKIEVCKGSIGFIDVIKNYRVLNLYKAFYNQFVSKEIDNKAVSFFPYFTEDFFYIHPYERNIMVNMNNYFDQTKQERVAELQRIAYELGAKKITINFMEAKKSFTSKDIKANAKGKVTGGNADIEIRETEKSSDSYTYSENITEEYEGSDSPKEPKLYYFSNESSIKNLIDMRLHGDHSVKHVIREVAYNTSNSINKSDAAKIDTAFQTYKVSGNASVSSAVEQESRMKLRYVIEF